jgi:hypothetical protein
MVVLVCNVGLYKIVRKSGRIQDVYVTDELASLRQLKALEQKIGLFAIIIYLTKPVMYLYVGVFSRDLFLNTVFAQVYFSAESILFKNSEVHT